MDNHTNDIIFYYKSLASIRLEHIHNVEHENRVLQRQLRNSSEAEVRHQNEARTIIAAANMILGGSNNGNTNQENGNDASNRAESDTFEDRFQSPNIWNREETFEDPFFHRICLFSNKRKQKSLFLKNGYSFGSIQNSQYLSIRWLTFAV